MHCRRIEKNHADGAISHVENSPFQVLGNATLQLQSVRSTLLLLLNTHSSRSSTRSDSQQAAQHGHSMRSFSSIVPQTTPSPSTAAEKPSSNANSISACTYRNMQSGKYTIPTRVHMHLPSRCSHATCRMLCVCSLAPPLRASDVTSPRLQPPAHSTPESHSS